MNFTVKILNKENNVITEKTSADELFVVYDAEYAEGDSIEISCDEKNVYAYCSLDDAMSDSFVYLKDSFKFEIPFAEKKLSYNPKSFTGSRHYLHIRKAENYEIRGRKNLALNPFDVHENSSMYPHSYANVETRGESVFASRNAIDGLVANTFHGEWPYSSWGINRNPDAELVIDFGRTVCADELVIYLRADFPHDSWWNSARVSFSDGSEMTLQLKKTGAAQRFSFEKKHISWVKLDRLIRADFESPFPALTQLEVYGSEI